MTRVLQAARLHLINPRVMLGIPWLVVGVSFLINLAVWHLTSADADGRFSGGVLALYITGLVIYVQAVTQLLPFGMGVGLSRRTFYLGTIVVALVQSLGYGVCIAVLVAIEKATGGWGAGMDYWAPGILAVDDPLLQAFVSGAPMLAFASVGVGAGIVQKRWGQAGTWILIVGSMLTLGVAAILLSWLDAWGALASWFLDQSVATLAIGLPLAVAAAAALVSLLGMRRVVP
jgi:hypothetical protein